MKSSLLAQSNVAETCSLLLRAIFFAPDPGSQWVYETIKQFLTQTDCLVGYVCQMNF